MYIYFLPEVSDLPCEDKSYIQNNYPDHYCIIVYLVVVIVTSVPTLCSGVAGKITKNMLHPSAHVVQSQLNFSPSLCLAYI